ncbi:uncharacterized protein LOC130237551 [Danio aesculapii]|uniref:uncharacterized protein LOC130237551 n=1 Tax=Danio aesculapii TaxID=1142201 RepID=UPI0024BF3F8A|nr:uncharacterized protein LOC130237551 [Danio aesculapii]
MALFIFITLQLLLEVLLQASTENVTSLSDSVSVMATGLAVVTSLPPTPENDIYTLTINEISEASTDLAITSSAEVMTDSETNMPNLTTKHNFNSSANTILESTTLIDTTEHTSVFTLITKGLESENKSNKRMFFFVAVAATGGGIFLTGLIGILMYGYTRKPKAQSIWFESRHKKQEVSLPVAGSDSIEEEDSVVYSTVKFIESTSPTAENTEESNPTEQESNALFYTILTQPPVSSDCETVYSQVTVL